MSFWNRPLETLSPKEWEALCDGCGKCCLVKLEDAETAEIEYTNIACKLFDDATCRCAQYEIRKSIVPSCVVITPENIGEIAYWMPATCAYRLRYEDKPLPDWHPLVSGNADSANEAGMTMQGRTVPEYEVDEEDLEDYVIEGLQ